MVNRSSQSSHRVACLVAGITALVALSACSSGDGDGGPDASETASAAPSAVDPAQLSSELLAQGVSASNDEPVAGADGTIKTGVDSTAPVRADVLSLARTHHGTLLRWRLSSPGGLVELAANPFNSLTFGDTENVALIDESRDVRLLPYRYRGEGDALCICSQIPLSLDTQGDILYGLYPALPDSATSVGIEIPGFPLIEKVAVTND
jgi:hypothetical protein